MIACGSIESCRMKYALVKQQTHDHLLSPFVPVDPTLPLLQPAFPVPPSPRVLEIEASWHGMMDTSFLMMIDVTIAAVAVLSTTASVVANPASGVFAGPVSASDLERAGVVADPSSASAPEKADLAVDVLVLDDILRALYSPIPVALLILSIANP
mmetsp:Transcript_5283/g.8801  ORF Transcript_5283/g.8801 Transcript_5283/m.8801 type:complete len:155 (+) Transcript_5283:266-730(+)